MKKLIISLSLILICYISFGQAIIQRSGVGNTVQDARLSAQYNFFVPRYADTTAALAGNSEGIDSCGAIIFTYDQMALWFRSCSGGKSWVMLDPSGIPSTGNSWIIGGNAGLFTSPVDPQYVGTKTVQGFGFKTSDIARLTIPSTGIARTSDAAYKYLMFDTSGSVHLMAYGDGGSGSTPTWQQTLTAGSTLTGTNSVDASNGIFEITNANYINFAADNNRGSNIVIYEDSIQLAPGLGNLNIDSLNYQSNANDSMMVWRPTTGAVGMRAIPSGGGGANTALSNLASVAINTSLLLGTSDAAALGSTTKQWSDLFLAEGGVINWDNGDVTMTQSGNNLTVDGGAFIVTNAEQTPASFTSTFAGNMQVNWNSSTGNNVNFVFQDAGTARWYVGNNSATGSDRLHILNASAQEAVTVLQGLQVGINQTAPTARLHLGAGVSTANYAPLKFTTGTNNTTAEAGAMEYTTPQLFFTNGRAVRQELFQGQQARVSTQYDNATTTLGNVTGLTVNVAASGTYRFEAKLFTTSDVAGGVKVAIGGTATATAIRYEGLTTDAGLTTQGRATALGTAVGAVTAVTAAYVVITGTITVNGAGTLTVQAAANAATGTTSVLTGSTFVLTEML